MHLSYFKILILMHFTSVSVQKDGQKLTASIQLIITVGSPFCYNDKAKPLFLPLICKSPNDPDLDTYTHIF